MLAELALLLSLRIIEGSCFDSFFTHDPEEIAARVRFVEYFGDNSSLAIVEYGAGVGETSFALSAKGHKVYALEDDFALYSILNSIPANSKFTTPIRLPISAGQSCFSNEVEIVCAFNYFSFLTLEEKSLAIQKAFISLKPGGVLLFSQLNPFSGNDSFKPSRYSREIAEGMILHHSVTHTRIEKPETQSLFYRYELEFRNEIIESTESELMLYPCTPEQLIASCADIGFEDAWVFKDLSMNPFDPQSPECFIVARK